MAGQSLLIQPSFDPRIRAYPSAMGVPVSVDRGYMIWDLKGGNLGYTGGLYGDGRDQVNFLFNPSTINSSFSVANASLQAAFLYPVPGSTSTLLAPLQQTVSFDLYYDRTYELNYGTGANGNGTQKANDPGVIGCQADVLQWMQFTGMLANLNNVSNVQTLLTGGAAFGSTTNIPTSALGNGGIMIMVPCWLYFSNLTQAKALTKTQANSVQALNSQLAYYGYVDSWSVNYTHWTQQMVPIRCVISVEFTMLPTPAAGSANSLAVARDTGNVGFTNTPPTPTGTVVTPITGSSAGVAGR
jgi:hypothetical protein